MIWLKVCNEIDVLNPDVLMKCFASKIFYSILDIQILYSSHMLTKLRTYLNIGIMAIHILLPIILNTSGI